MRRIISFWLPALLCATAAIPLRAQTYTTLHTFGQGVYETNGLLQAADGYIYSTTYYEQIPDGTGYGGTIYKVTPGGTFTTLYRFCPPVGSCPQSWGPDAPLIQAPNGSLYGTTSGYPGHPDIPGAVFAFENGQATTLHTFCSLTDCADGETPAGIVQSANGNLYGTTEQGGASGLGTIYQLALNGTLTTLYDFRKDPQNGCPDGRQPDGTLVQLANGDFYGNTFSGGSFNLYGTLFKITPSGALTTLHTFCTEVGCPDGESPTVGLTLAADGNLYGVSQYGGNNSGAGTIFKLTPDGLFTTLYSLCPEGGTCPDGVGPDSQLVAGSDGALYGGTEQGGANGQGVIFKISLAGEFTNLFDISNGGANNLLQDTNGDFYGTTPTTLFRLPLGLHPFIKTVPTFGQGGSTVEILGTDLSGATAVTFDGTPAAFQVVSSTEITAAVPEGASSGKIQVVTSTSALSSNLPFTVTP